MRMMLSWDWGSHYSPHTAEEAEKYALEWKDRATDMFDARSIKVFYDGALDSYTALLLEDYEGRPGFKGSSHKSKGRVLQGHQTHQPERHRRHRACHGRCFRQGTRRHF